MLNKLQTTALAGLLLAVLRSFGLEAPAEFGEAMTMLINALLVIIPVAIGWFTPESRVKIQRLRTKP